MFKKLGVSIPVAAILAVSGIGVNFRTAKIEMSSAIAQYCVKSENFSLVVASTNGITLRSATRLDARTGEAVAYQQTVDFDAWTYGEEITDLWGARDALWFKLRGRDRWVPSGYMKGFPPSKPSTRPGGTPTCPDKVVPPPPITSLSEGNIIQTTSGACIHPQGGADNPANNTPIVLHRGSCQDRLPKTQFRLLSSGSIQHIPSGKCIHPLGGDPNSPNGTKLILFDGCNENRLSFRRTGGGSLQYAPSGKCIHPSGGSAQPADNTELVLHDGCDEPRLAFNIGVVASSDTLGIPVNWSSPAYRQNNLFWPTYAPPSVGGTLNAPGNCTWYANGRLRELGYSSAALNNLRGNAVDWANQARNAGMSVGNQPRVGAIAHWNSNHVAVVEKINSDNTVVISESSYPFNGAPTYLYRQRTIPASLPSNYIYVPR